MKSRLPVFFLVFTLTLISALNAQTVVTYPAPEGEKAEGAYSVTVNGQAVDVYSTKSQYWDGEYYFAYFDFEGAVSVEIQSDFPMAGTQVLPAERFGLDVKTDAKSVKFTAEKPFRVSVEPNGRVKPLLLFGNALEKDAPKADDPNVIYFGPGVHQVGKLEVKDGQTVYLAGGSVVKGGIDATGKNITICGRGILCGADYPRFKGPNGFPINAKNCENLVIRDITIRASWSWTCTTWNCRGVLIDGLKICCSNMINDDALDLVNTQDVVVRNCFFRSQDDSIAVKGCLADHRPCENIEIEDCQFWTDVANIYRIGYECTADVMRNIHSRRIDVLHYSKDFRPCEHYWANTIFWLQPNQDMTIENCTFEDFVVYSDGSNGLMLVAKPQRCTYGAVQDPNPGRLKNCSFKDLRVVGTKGDFEGLIYLRGDAPQWDVDGIHMENVTYFGEPVTQNSPCVRVDGEFVKNFEIK